METPTSGNVIDLFSRTPGPRDEKARVRVQDEAERLSSSDVEISIAQLYPLAKEINPQLADATPKLEEALELLQEARIHFRDGDRLLADDYAQRLRILLPELFFFDRLGDGFRTIVLASFHALVNLDGIPLNQDQAVVLKEALELIRHQPFVGFESALEIHDLFERAGLQPDPKALDVLAEAMEPNQEDEDIAVGE